MHDPFNTNLTNFENPVSITSVNEFGVDRTTVYRLLKEHGIQDLHKVIHDRK